MKQSQRMTRKDALNILSDMRDAYIRSLSEATSIYDAPAFEEWKKVSGETWDALRKLTEAVYGLPHGSQRPSLCNVCRHRYAEHDVQEKEQADRTWCCTPCLERLEAEKKLVDIPGITICLWEKEVQA